MTRDLVGELVLAVLAVGCFVVILDPMTTGTESAAAFALLGAVLQAVVHIVGDARRLPNAT